MNLVAMLLRRARLQPHMPAVYSGSGVFATLSELTDRAARIGAFLRATEGSRPVALFMKNRPEYFEVLCGAWWAGLPAVPVNAKLHAKELAQLAEDAGVRICFTDAISAPVVEAAAVLLPYVLRIVVIESHAYRAILARQAVLLTPLTPDEVAWIFFTSGTTGRSKGALLTHGNLAAMCRAYEADLAVASMGDRMIHLAPMSHGSGLYGLPILFAGGAQVVPESGGFDVSEAFQLLSRHKQCITFLAPTMLRRLVESPTDCERVSQNIKMIVYGGGPMYLADIKRALGLFGPRLAQIYGQGETPMTITALSCAAHWSGTDVAPDRVLSSVGFTRSATEVKILRPAEDERPDAPGEILVKGATVMKGYLGLPRETEETLRDGWLHTGDIGELDSHGLLHLRDRSKDVVISGGSNIYPREVEEVLLTHTGITEACAVGVPDPEWGEVLVAAYTSVDGQTIDPLQLDALILASLARFKRPKRYVQMQLPKNHYGKILKREVREQLGRAVDALSGT